MRKLIFNAGLNTERDRIEVDVSEYGEVTLPVLVTSGDSRLGSCLAGGPTPDVFSSSCDLRPQTVAVMSRLVMRISLSGLMFTAPSDDRRLLPVRSSWVSDRPGSWGEAAPGRGARATHVPRPST